MLYAVIDTNVFISALITKNPEAATAEKRDDGLQDRWRQLGYARILF